MGVVFSPDNKNNSRWARVKMKVASLRAGPDVQGLLQVDGCQQGWHPGQERLRGAFDNIGVLMSEGELDELMGEVGGPCNVNGMINMFQEKMAGDGNDPDELILQAFMAYDQGGKIDVKMFQHALMTWGDKMNKTEIDDIFNEFEIDEDYMVKTKEVVGLFVAVKEEEKKEEKKEEAPAEAPADDEGGDDAKKKKKKKKKAAK